MSGYSCSGSTPLGKRLSYINYRFVVSSGAMEKAVSNCALLLQLQIGEVVSTIPSESCADVSDRGLPTDHSLNSDWFQCRDRNSTSVLCFPDSF